MLNATPAREQRGVTLLEVLLTIVILVFGLLGLAGFQARIQVVEVEAYQRAQALLLLNDMVDRINSNRSEAANYQTGVGNPLGTGDTQPADCAALPVGTPAQRTTRDQCEWSNALKGAAEVKAAGNVGAMIGARGCIEQVQAPAPVTGVCTPGTYRVTTAWQGLNPTTAPALGCASAMYGGDDRMRRAVSLNVVVALLGC